MYENAFLFTLTLSMTGCFGHISYPNQAKVCPAGSKSPWDENQRIQIKTAKGINEIYYYLTDVTERMVVYDDRQNYWVQVIFNNSLKSEMDYEPDQAFVATKNKVVHAENRLYLPSANKRLPGYETLPINRDIPKEQTLFIKFPLMKPNFDEQWRINFGSIKVDGQTISLPPYKLCQQKGVSRFYRYKGAF